MSSDRRTSQVANLEEDRPSLKNQALSIQFVITGCILLTVLTAAAHIWAGQEKLTLVTLGVPTACIAAFLAMSWSAYSSHTYAFGLFMFASVVLYMIVIMAFSQDYAVLERIVRDVPKWVIVAGAFILFMIHWHFVEVLYKYAKSLRGYDVDLESQKKNGSQP